MSAVLAKISVTHEHIQIPSIYKNLGIVITVHIMFVEIKSVHSYHRTSIANTMQLIFIYFLSNF